MGMLDRYKKPGGFLQLLNLIETCGKDKQEKLLAMIFNENQYWCSAIKQKMLSMERILTWPDEIVAEVFNKGNELTVATALSGLSAPNRERVFAYFSHGQQRRIKDLLESKAVSPGEVAAANAKIIEEVRQMISSGFLRADGFDSKVTVSEDIEDLLARGYDLAKDELPLKSGPQPTVPKSAPTVPEPAVAATTTSDVKLLQTKVRHLTSENGELKRKIQVLEEKLAQIKKIA